MLLRYSPQPASRALARASKPATKTPRAPRFASLSETVSRAQKTQAPRASHRGRRMRQILVVIFGFTYEHLSKGLPKRDEEIALCWVLTYDVGVLTACLKRPSRNCDPCDAKCLFATGRLDQASRFPQPRRSPHRWPRMVADIAHRRSTNVQGVLPLQRARPKKHLLVPSTRREPGVGQPRCNQSCAKSNLARADRRRRELRCRTSVRGHRPLEASRDVHGAYQRAKCNQFRPKQLKAHVNETSLIAVCSEHIQETGTS